MKDYVIFYKFYPFNVCNLVPDKITINAENLEAAFSKLESMYGDRIEIFKEPARKHYNEQ